MVRGSRQLSSRWVCIRATSVAAARRGVEKPILVRDVIPDLVQNLRARRQVLSLAADLVQSDCIMGYACETDSVRDTNTIRLGCLHERQNSPFLNFRHVLSHKKMHASMLTVILLVALPRRCSAALENGSCLRRALLKQRFDRSGGCSRALLSDLLFSSLRSSQDVCCLQWIRNWHTCQPELQASAGDSGCE